MRLIAAHAALHATLDLSCRVVSARVNSTCANPLWCRRLPDCTASDEGLRSHSCTMLPSFPTQAFKNASKLSNTSSARLNESWTLLRARAAKLAMQCMVLNERRAQMHDDMSDMLETLEQVASQLQPTAHTLSRRACRVPMCVRYLIIGSSARSLAIVIATYPRQMHMRHKQRAAGSLRTAVRRCREAREAEATEADSLDRCHSTHSSQLGSEDAHMARVLPSSIGARLAL